MCYVWAVLIAFAEYQQVCCNISHAASAAAAAVFVPRVDGTIIQGDGGEAKVKAADICAGKVSSADEGSETAHTAAAAMAAAAAVMPSDCTCVVQ